MSSLHQKRKKFASVLEKARKQSESSSICESASLFSAEYPDSSPTCYGDSSATQQRANTTTPVPRLESPLLNPMGWPTSLFGSSDVSCSSQLSPCIDGDGWPSDSSFSCPWNPGTDLDFLEADTADQLLSKAVSAGEEVTQTSMDLLDFLDDQNHTISHLGACMDMDDPLFTGTDSPALSLFGDLEFDPKPDCLKSDAWLNDPMTSNRDLDDLLMRSTSALQTPHRQSRSSLLQPLSLSATDYFHCIADRVTKKRHANPSKDMSAAELLFRKERNRLRSKAYRLRRKMQFESMKKEVTQARQKIQEVQRQTQST